MKNPFELTGQVVIVTGGCGHLGSAITQAFSDAGAIVYPLSRKPGDAPKQFEGSEIHPTALDVTDERAFEGFVETLVKKHGRVDCLVNHAAAAKRERWEDLDKKAWLEGFEGTLHHYFTCAKAVSKPMLAAKHGAIINTGSMMSILAPHFPMHLDLNNAAAAHHSAAKGAVIQLTRHLAALWGTQGIRVNAVSPGYFPRKRGPERPDYMQELTVRIPMKRIGQPVEVAGAYVFLASQAASYITGHNLVVDGGFSIW